MKADRPSLNAELELARAEVLIWLNGCDQGAVFAREITAETALAENEKIADHFLSRIRDTGFELEVVDVGEDGSPAFDPRWTHCDNQFVGFKQPPPAPSREEAKLLACAALLRNDWCRARLPKVGESDATPRR